MTAPYDPGELVATLVGQAHTIRRLEEEIRLIEAGNRQLEDRNRQLEELVAQQEQALATARPERRGTDRKEESS